MKGNFTGIDLTLNKTSKTSNKVKLEPLDVLLTFSTCAQGTTQ